MIELRLLALAGIVAVSLAAVVVVLAVDALLRWVTRLRARRAARPAAPRSLPSPGASEADRVVRMRQATWRLRC